MAAVFSQHTALAPILLMRGAGDLYENNAGNRNEFNDAGITDIDAGRDIDAVRER